MLSRLQWRPLPLPASSDLPLLLAAIDIGSSAYTLHVTDLANIWAESLDRRAICTRGWDQNTSIDPSDTSENMSTFLNYLRSALDPSHTDCEQTSVTLSPGTVQNCGQDGLLMKITCDIPGLASLKWPVHLHKCSPSSLTTSLVLPLVEAQHTRTVEVESLKQALSYKDAILTKVLDKLEATGTGLDQIFNVLTGKKKVTRAVAESKVKGLAPFSSDQWKRQVAEDPDSSIKSPEELIQKVFGGSGLQYPDGLDVKGSAALDTWWHDFKPTSKIPLHSPKTQVSLSEETSLKPSDATADTGARKEQQDDGDDDEFQVQATPPRKKNPIAKESLDDNVSTADEDDNLNPSLARSSSPRNQSDAPKKLAARIGRVGGNLAKTKRSSADQEPAVAARASVKPETISLDQTPAPQDCTSETASEDEGDQSNQEVDADATGSLSDSSSSRSARARQEKSAASGSSTKIMRSDDPDNQSDSKPGVAWRIGRVGGKAAPTNGSSDKEGSSKHQDDPPGSGDSEQGPESTDTVGDAPTDVGSVPPRRIGLIGRIGGEGSTRSGPSARSAPVVQDSKINDHDRSRSESRTDADSSKGAAKRETSQERVARKREEMKRELEKKAAVGPAKKKRRF